jgi:hypothetical protein
MQKVATGSESYKYLRKGIMSDNRVKKILNASCLSAESVMNGDDSSQLSSKINLRKRVNVSEKIGFDHAVHFQNFVTSRLIIIITHSPVILAMLLHSCVVVSTLEVSAFSFSIARRYFF